MLTASTRWGTRSSDRITACRRRLLGQALAGVDEHQAEVGGRGAGDHVAGVLHVARGVGDDELAGRRREVAVGDVDRDALLALGAQAVGQQGQVGVVVAARRGWWPRRPRAGPRRSTSSRAAAGRSGWTCRRRPSRRWRNGAGPSEVALLLAVLHGGLGEPVVATGGAALGDPGDGDLLDDLGDGVGRRTPRSRSGSCRRRCGSARSLLDDLLAGLGTGCARSR